MDFVHVVLLSAVGVIALLFLITYLNQERINEMAEYQKSTNCALRDDITAWRVKAQELSKKNEELEAKLAKIREAANDLVSSR